MTKTLILIGFIFLASVLNKEVAIWMALMFFMGALATGFIDLMLN